MGNLTANISQHEIACQCSHESCNGKEVAHMPLIEAMQAATDYFAEVYNTRARFMATSGNRCPKHNYDVLVGEGYSHGAAENSKSQHKNFIACDHHIDILQSGEWNRVDPKELYSYYVDQHPKSCGIGLYWNRVHLDMRGKPGRWG